MAALIDRRAFSDFHGLEMLGKGQLPSIQETKRRIFIAERRTDVGRPDHFYKGYLEDRLGEAKHVGELPLLVLQRLAARYIERREGRLAVRLDRFGEWHELVPYISPLAVIVCFLVEEGRGPKPGSDPMRFLSEEIGDTALLGPLDRPLDDLIERSGLFELHMHLNGSTELDVIWPEACSDPDAYFRELSEAARKTKEPTAELYEQMEAGLGPLALFRRLRAVRRARRFIAEAIRYEGSELGNIQGPVNLSRLLAMIRSDSTDRRFEFASGMPLSAHPSRILFPHPSRPGLAPEAAWLYACLLKLKADPSDAVVGTGLYFTFLVYSQIARLSVQQVDETGFDQFQKYTFAGARDAVEKRYENRFRQLNGKAPFDTLAHLEGRFAPKDTRAATCRLISTILDGYLAFRGCHHRKRLRELTAADSDSLPESMLGCLAGSGCAKGCRTSGRHDAEFVLVAHFIKRRTNHSNDQVRRYLDSDLRLVLRTQARVVCGLHRENEVVRSLLRGIDGASNELHAPPEPFAPAFRMGRRTGIPNATFHVGEDFRHLLSGIRATSEALTFLDMGAGDRLGHAIALGIDPDLWLARCAPRTFMSRLDVLDDAVFAHQALAQLGGYDRDIVRLEGIVANYSEQVYGTEFSPALLHRAWALRHLDIIEVRRLERAVTRSGLVPDHGTISRHAELDARRTIDADRAAELTLIGKEVATAGSAYDVFSRRHALGRKGWEATVEVEATMVSPAALAALQDSTMSEVNRRGVAIEALPTSNLRISYYDELAEHHLFRWLGLAGPAMKHRPTVVIGTDDPGIFATSLRNEYAAISSVLREKFGKSSQETIAIVELLNDAGRIRRFRPPASPSARRSSSVRRV